MATSDNDVPVAVNENETTEAVENVETTGNSLPSTETAGPQGDTETPVVVETPAHVTEAEELFKMLTSDPNCHSLLRKHLSQAIFDKLKEKKTSLGGTLADCIRSGE